MEGMVDMRDGIPFSSGEIILGKKGMDPPEVENK